MFFVKFSLAISVTCSIILVIVSDNYPEGASYKPCARLKNTVTYQGRICVDNGAGGFEEESEKICKESFKNTCPEFNEATCEWITNISFPNISVGPSPIPCCRLKYFARDYTWMEIYFTLQYGKDVPVYDIVEIRRSKIKNHESFGNRDQNDWPESVTDPTGERGLTWIVATNFSKPLKISGSPTDFCANDNDTRCTVDVLQYFSGNFPNGFNNSLLPTISNHESGKRDPVLSYSYSSACRDIWVEKQKARACQILYWYNSTYHMYVANKFRRNRNLVFQFLEVQAYYRPSISSSSNLVVRYAYWSNAENPENREEIFNAYYMHSNVAEINSK